MAEQLPSGAKALTFYSAWFCPFAQRAWLALLHKGLAFDYVEVDPYNETDWWLETSRGRAMVPVVVSPASINAETGRSEATTVIDSARVLEYLDELAPDSGPLYPGSVNQRAELRFWVDHINERIVPYLYRFLKAAEPGDHRDESRTALIRGLREFSEALSADGPFFAGERLTAVDMALYPFAYRIDLLLSHFRDFRLPEDTAGWARYRRWVDSMAALPIVQQTLTDAATYEQRLIDFYEPYSRGEGQKSVENTP